MTLDLRGKRYEEAMNLLDKYIDDLLLVGMKQASIIHGFGTGVIRELVQSFVKNNKNILSYRYGGENEGGFGVTVITLK
jgi:DNA mismatch repair protein MutS2